MRQGGLKKKRSRINRKACSSRTIQKLAAIGQPNTIGARWKRNWTPYRSSFRRSMVWTFISSTFAQNMKMRCRSSSARMALVDHLTVEDYRSTDQSHSTWGDLSDGFHLVIPSMPGYGFSGEPTTTG